MNLLVHPSNGFNLLSVETDVSRALIQVVPIAQIFLRFIKAGKNKEVV